MSMRGAGLAGGGSGGGVGSAAGPGVVSLEVKAGSSSSINW